MLDRSDNFRTFDGVEIRSNLRVFGYDGQWGNVDPEQFEFHNVNRPSGIHGELFNGWYDVILDDGSKAYYNGTRMITRTILSVDPNPNRMIGKDGVIECINCISVTMGTCMDADCNCHHS